MTGPPASTGTRPEQQLAGPLDDELYRAILQRIVLIEVNMGACLLFGKVREYVCQGSQPLAVGGYGHRFAADVNAHLESIFPPYEHGLGLSPREQVAPVKAEAKGGAQKQP